MLPYFLNKVNNSGICVSYDETVNNPLADDHILNYFTWEKRKNSINDNNYNDFTDWFDSVTYKGKYKELLNECGEDLKVFNVKLSNALNENGLFALLIAKNIENNEYSVEINKRFVDSSIVGVAWETKEHLCTNHKKTEFSHDFIEELMELVKYDLDAYNAWINGEVFIFRYFKDSEDDNETDACFGSFGMRTNEEWLEDACSYFGLDKNEFI